MWGKGCKYATLAIEILIFMRKKHLYWNYKCKLNTVLQKQGNEISQFNSNSIKHIFVEIIVSIRADTKSYTCVGGVIQYRCTCVHVHLYICSLDSLCMGNAIPRKTQAVAGSDSLLNVSRSRKYVPLIVRSSWQCE